MDIHTHSPQIIYYCRKIACVVVVVVKNKRFEVTREGGRERERERERERMSEEISKKEETTTSPMVSV